MFQGKYYRITSFVFLFFYGKWLCVLTIDILFHYLQCAVLAWDIKVCYWFIGTTITD